MDEQHIDTVMRTLYQARSQSAREMTDERWARVKGRFRTTMRALRQDAIQMIEDGEFDE